MTAPTPLEPEQLAAYFSLMEVSNLLQHAVEQQLREAGGLSYVQFQVLACLSDAADGTERMTDLADQLVHSRSGLTYQAAQLEKRGLVTRRPSAEDERSILVTLTAEGRALLGTVMNGHVELIRQVFLEPLAATDVTVLARVLNQVRDHMRAAPPRSAAPRRRAAD